MAVIQRVIANLWHMPSPPRLPRSPEARTEKVDNLIDKALRGLIRVPRFQRGLKWEATHVQDLFDSIYRGYPIGSLLFFKRQAKAERLQVGPLTIQAPELSEAWWVVDGQQRITSLTACLARPVPLPTSRDRSDPFVLYFDVNTQKFKQPPVHDGIPSTWVPLPCLLDASRLSEWAFHWQHGQEADLRRVLFEAGTRLREYTVPLYLIAPEEEAVAKEIFLRTNQSGKPLEWTEVHAALFGQESTHPATLDQLAEELAQLGMGRPGEDRLLTCLFALRGLDPTRNLAEHRRRDPEVLEGAVPEALPVLRRVLSFLHRDAGIPHLRFLPRSTLLDVLTRFFYIHEFPSRRSRTLLSRWFWRTVVGASISGERTVRRQGIGVIDEDEEESVQRLLGLLHKEPPRAFELPASFDARADATRLVLLALASLRPRDLQTAEPLEVAALVDEQGGDSFVKIIKGSRIEGSRSPANRMIQAKGTPALRLLRRRVAQQGVDDPLLRGHAIDPQAAQLLASDELEGFLARRAEALTSEVRRLIQRRAAWEHSDRPSIEHLLEEAGVGL